jgi:hypothetical protein
MGGLIMFLILRKEDHVKAVLGLKLGIIMTFLDIVAFLALMSIGLGSIL